MAWRGLKNLLGLLLLLVTLPVMAGTYTDSAEPFSWIDSATHSNVVWTAAPGGPANECSGGSAAVDDDISQELPLGFSFNFGGVNYTTARIMSNGRVQFSNNYCGYGTQVVGPPRIYPYPMPDTRLARTLRLYGGDLDPSAGGTVRYATLGSAPNRMFVVTFANVPEWNAAGSSFDAQLILHENGDFVFQYRNISNPTQGHPQIGWEVATDDYQLIDYNTATDLQNTAFRFSTHTPAPLAYYAMDELAWNGTAGEVQDGSGNGNNGDRVANADTIDPGYICRGGNFSNNNAAVDSTLNVRNQIGSRGTVTFWYNSNTVWDSGNRMLMDGSRNNGGSGADKYFFLVKRNNTGRLRFRLEDSNDTDLQAETSNNSYAAGTWHHVAITWDINNDADWLQIYIDGTRRATNRGNLNGPLNITGLLGNLNTLYFGDNRTGGVSGNGYTRNSANGIEDEARIYTEVLSAAQINNDMNQTHECLLTNLHMDEAAWNGTVDEVVDSSGKNNHGTGINGATTGGNNISDWAIPSNPGTCRYGTFDGNDDYVALPGFPDLNGSFTIGAWIRPRAINNDQRIFADDENNSGGFAFSLGDPGDGRLRFFSRNVSPVSLDSPAVITANSWYYVTAVHDAAAKTRQIYVNANPVTAAATYTGNWGTDTGLASVGGETNGAGSEAVPNWRFDGDIDEVRVYSRALSQAEIAAVMNETHACTIVPTLDHLEIQHDGTALTCNPENVTIRACANADCSSLYADDVTVTLTPTGWVGGDTQVVTGGSSTFQLRHTLPEVVTLGISSSTPLALNPATCLNTSDSSNSCDLTFYDTGFIYTVPTQTSCQTSASITVAAVRKDITTQQCVPSFANRNETINFWTTYVNPASGTNQLTLNNGSTDYLLATAAPGTGVPLAFDANGEATVTVTYPDAGQLTLNSRFDGSGAESGLVMTGGATYVTKPARLYVYSDDLNSDCASADLACSAFRQAGQAFTLKVRAACADTTVTPNFEHNNISITHNLVAPAAGNAGTIDVGTTAITAGDNGERAIANQAVSEVGVFSFMAQLTAGSPYFGETTIGDAASNTSVNIGRFYPAYFDVTRIHGCAAGAFTYSGQPFSVTATAYNSNSVITQNYSGALGFAQPTTVSDAGDTGNFTNNVIPAANFGNPQAAAGTRNDITYTFPSVETAPTTITLRAEDPDGVSSLGHLEETTDIHSGRVAIENAFGSELVDLSVPTRVQHYDGSDFVDFSNDTCSVMSLTLGKIDGTLNVGNGGTAGDTCIWDDAGNSGANNCSDAGILPGPVALQYTEPANNADFNLYLKAPGAGFTGNVDVTGIVDSWLQYDWKGAGKENPVGRATFGIYRGDDRIIYWRERFE